MVRIRKVRPRAPATGRLGRQVLAAIRLACLLVAGAPALADGPAVGPLVAAASDLRFALPEIAESFRRETGESVRLAFGSSGNFARQIRQGAPFEVYLSADEAYVLALASDGLTRDEGTVYAVGRLAIVVPPGSPLAQDRSLDGLARALGDAQISRFAIANPEHAPYGRRAREALERRGLWEALQPVLVLGENVAQAAQFAASGSADGGIVALSLALAPSVAARADYGLIPEKWHSPLRQRMVLLKNAGRSAERFYDYLRSARARELLGRHGFAAPDGPG